MHKVVLYISKRAWEYQVRAKRQEPGRYYAELVGLDGSRLEPRAITGSYPSLDCVEHNADAIYLSLVAMRERAAVPA